MKTLIEFAEELYDLRPWQKAYLDKLLQANVNGKLFVLNNVRGKSMFATRPAGSDKIFGREITCVIFDEIGGNMDLSKLKYYTTAAWLRGYASSFADDETSKAVVYRLKQAAELLDAVWDEYAQKEGL